MGSLKNPSQSFSTQAFTMIEMLSAIVILAIIAAVAFVYVGNYIDYSRLTAAKRTCTILNESLDEYRALGGLNKAYSMNGSSGSTLNAATLTSCAIEALKDGFKNEGKTVGFLWGNQSINTSYIGSTGSGKDFRFVLDEDTALSTSQSTQTTATMTMGLMGYGMTSDSDGLVRVMLRAKIDGSYVDPSDLIGDKITLTVGGLTYTGVLSKYSSTIAVTYITIPSGLETGNYSLTASFAQHSVGDIIYPAASATDTLNVTAADEAIGFIEKAAAGTVTCAGYSTTGYMAFKDDDGDITIIKTGWPAATQTLPSSLSYYFWSCASATDSSAAGAINELGFGSVGDLVTIDISECTALSTVILTNNELTSLDVSKNTLLRKLLCNSNSITSLDVSKNTALERLTCQSNSITSLDLTNNTALTILRVDSDVTLTGVPDGCTVTTY